ASHTPLSPFFISTPKKPVSGMSALNSFTPSALGAWTRNVIFLSAETSVELNPGARGPNWPCAATGAGGNVGERAGIAARTSAGLRTISRSKPIRARGVIHQDFPADCGIRRPDGKLVEDPAVVDRQRRRDVGGLFPGGVTLSGCGQSVPHTMRSGFAVMSA